MTTNGHRPVHRVVVVGYGMAGGRFVEELRDRDPERRFQVTVVGAEPYRAYNRVLLSTVLAKADPSDLDPDGGVAEDLALTPPGWAAEQGVETVLGSPAVAIDRDARTVTTASGAHLPYDTLVLATGSRPWLPPVTGLDIDGKTDGVLVFRTVDDCRRILERARPGARVVVLGGGLLGLEAARGLAGRGASVRVIHHAGHLMERQLDQPAGQMLGRALRDLGVRVQVNATAQEVLTEPIGPTESLGPADGRRTVTGLRLADGRVVPTDLLVVSCGVRPETDLARAAGLPIGQGVLVDDGLRSVADPSVYAIGECAEHDGRLYGLVAPAWEQARIAAARITGVDPTLEYRGSRMVTRLKAAGIDLAAMGEVDVDPLDVLEAYASGAGGAFADDVDDDLDPALGDARPDDADARLAGDTDARLGADPEARPSDEARLEVLQFADPTRGTYKKIVLTGGVVSGAILLGQIETVGTVVQLFDRQEPAPSDRLTLLFGGRSNAPQEATSPALIPDRATVCQCNGVTKAAITACVLAGARTVDQIASATRASTGCGSCRDAVEGIAEWVAAAEPAPQEVPA